MVVYCCHTIDPLCSSAKQCKTARYLSQRSIPVFCAEVVVVSDVEEDESDGFCDKGLEHHAVTKDTTKSRYTNFVDIKIKIRK